MTEEELRVRCEALAGVGDTAAAATLKLLDEVVELRKRPKANTTYDPVAVGTKLSHAMYVLGQMRGSLELAEKFGVLPSRDGTVKRLAEKADAAARAEQILRAEKSPEEAAAAATRAARGLAPVAPPEVTAVAADGPAGHYDRTPKMDQKSGE